MKIRNLRIFGLVAIALCLASCKFQAKTIIQPNGSGELTTEVGFSAEERQNLEKNSQNNGTTDFCNSSSSSKGVDVREEQRGDETWCVTTTSFKNLDELRRLYEQKKGLKIIRLEILNDKLYYEIEVDTQSKSSDFSAFSSTIWTVTMPDVPTSYNAGRVDGNTLTWDISPNDGLVKIQAESAVPAGFSFPCGAALIGPGLIIFCSQWIKVKRHL